MATSKITIGRFQIVLWYERKKFGRALKTYELKEPALPKLRSTKHELVTRGVPEVP